MRVFPPSLLISSVYLDGVQFIYLFLFVIISLHHFSDFMDTLIYYPCRYIIFEVSHQFSVYKSVCLKT